MQRKRDEVRERILKTARTSNNVTLDEIAKVCHCTRSNVWAFEAGRTHNERLMVLYIYWFNLSIKDLMAIAFTYDEEGCK